MSLPEVELDGDGARRSPRSPLQSKSQSSPGISEPHLFDPAARPEVRGKFIFAGGKKLFGRGVTYGPFVPAEDGSQYHDAATVAADFAQIARMGANAVRTYTVPPRWLLDVAFDHGLRVMVGFGWEQHITFLDERVEERDPLADRAMVRS